MRDLFLRVCRLPVRLANVLRGRHSGADTPSFPSRARAKSDRGYFVPLETGLLPTYRFPGQPVRLACPACAAVLEIADFCCAECREPVNVAAANRTLARHSQLLNASQDSRAPEDSPGDRRSARPGWGHVETLAAYYDRDSSPD